MPLFLTSALPFLAHDHASAAAFLTCRYHNFHGSMIPEFLSDEERVQKFCKARQHNRQSKYQLTMAGETRQYKNCYKLFVQTPLMQFSPSLLLHEGTCAESVIKSLLATKYFTRSLQRVRFVDPDVPLTKDLFQDLSQVRSLTDLDLGWIAVEDEHMEVIINSFPSLETLTIHDCEKIEGDLNKNQEDSSLSQQAPLATNTTVRTLTLYKVVASTAVKLVPRFTNVRKLTMGPYDDPELDLHPLCSSLPLLSDLFLKGFTIKNTESLKNLGRLSSIEFSLCSIPDLNFLEDQSNGTAAFPQLRTLWISDWRNRLISSFASLVHAPNLEALSITSDAFNNGCLKYLENMVHLRKLDLRSCDIQGDLSLKRLLQSLAGLEELDLSGCSIGNECAILQALYNRHSQLRVLNLDSCELVDADLKGIGALKNSLEELVLSSNEELTTEALVHCSGLKRLKSLRLGFCDGVDDLSPLGGCVNLGNLDVTYCSQLTDDSFKIFSEEPNSFPNLQSLEICTASKLTGKTLEHLSKNNHLVYQLKDLHFNMKLTNVLESSETARNNICKLQGLRKLDKAGSAKTELMRRLKNIEQMF